VGPVGPKGDAATLSFAIVFGITGRAFEQLGAATPLVDRHQSRRFVEQDFDTSKLKITYQDTLGARAALFNGCSGASWSTMPVVATFSDGDLENSAMGWRITNGSHLAWGLGFSSGQHIVRVDFLRTTNATDCLSGWNTTGNFLSVEEIP
jgi:hypothetical protein